MRAQHGYSANYYVVYPGNTPENHPPTAACMINSKQHRGCSIQDRGTRGKHQTKKIIPVVPAGGVGCRIQDTWLPVVENSRQRVHSAGTVHGAPLKGVVMPDADVVMSKAQNRVQLWAAFVIVVNGGVFTQPPMTNRINGANTQHTSLANLLRPVGGQKS